MSPKGTSSKLPGLHVFAVHEVYALLLFEVEVEACDVVHGELAGCDVHDAASLAFGFGVGEE